MKFLRRLFHRRQQPFFPEPLSHDARAWQRNMFPRFKHFIQ